MALDLLSSCLILPTSEIAGRYHCTWPSCVCVEGGDHECVGMSTYMFVKNRG